MMYTLDANIFARTLDLRQPDQSVCQALIDRLAADEQAIITPAIVVPEIAAAVRAMTGDPMRARIFLDILREMTNLRFVAVDDTLAQEAADLAADEGLRGMDALYVAVAKQHQCIFVSLDDLARTRAARLVSALTPAQALAALEA